MQDPVLGEGTICFRILSNSSHISMRLSLVVCLGALARASGCFPWEQLSLVTLSPPGSITSLSTFFEVGIPISLSEVTQCRRGWQVLCLHLRCLVQLPFLLPPGHHRPSPPHHSSLGLPLLLYMGFPLLLSPVQTKSSSTLNISWLKASLEGLFPFPGPL